MEVHHPHHVTHKKKWGEYILEFFMLFLAVFLGFVAENIREHYVETRRAKEYVKSLYDDLKIDTAIIERNIQEKFWRESKLDSLDKILSSGNYTENNYRLYYLERFLYSKDIFTPQDVTYQQLRSSGNFRYIQNNVLYKKIADYYNLCSRYQLGDNFAINLNLSEIESKIFNSNDLNSFNNVGNSIYETVKKLDRNLVPINPDKPALNLLHNKVGYERWISSLMRNFLEWLKENAIEIINITKKEYHLE